MKKTHSLKNKEDFNEIITKGKSIYLELFNLYYLDNDKFLIGISVPKKLGNAVYRNKQKRIIKNILDDQNLFKDLNKKIILITKKNILNNNFLQIKKEIEKTFQKLKNGK